MSETTENIAEEEKTNQEEKKEEQAEIITPEVPKKNLERNWDEAREVMRLQKQRIEELESKAALQMQQKKEEPDEFDKLDSEDYVTVGKAKELAKKTASKEAAQIAKQIVQEYLQQNQIIQDEQRMRNKYEDFDFVIENFAIPMIKNDPALAYKVQNSKNPAEVAYKLAKISDEYEASKMKQQTNEKAEKVLKNASRPVSANAVGHSLKSASEDFSKMSSQQIWEMSQKYARGA
jgi:hypothetical protein